MARTSGKPAPRRAEGQARRHARRWARPSLNRLPDRRNSCRVCPAGGGNGGSAGRVRV